MKKSRPLLRLLTAFILIMLPAVLLSCSKEKTPELPATGVLTARGKELIGRDGKPVLLQGVNIGNWLVQEFWMGPTEATGNVRCEKELEETLLQRFGEEKAAGLLNTYLDHYFTATDFDRIAALGVNCVRLPLWYGSFTDDSGNFREDAFSRVDWFVEEAAKRGLYVILDMHGAYGSQNGSDHSGIDGGDDKMARSEFFFGDSAAENQELFYVLWEKIAAHFRDNPTVAGYDLLNEPFCSWRYDSGRTDRELHEMLYEIYDTAYRRIRAVDPDHLIIFEAVWDPSDLPKPKTYGWINVMYEYHQYEYSDYDNREGAQIAALKRKLRKIRRAGYDVPSYLGEFTLFNSMEAWEEGLSLLQKRNISWTFWSYKCMVQNDNWGIVRLDAAKVNPETDSYEDILEKWSAVSEAEENTALTEVLREALK